LARSDFSASGSFARTALEKRRTLRRDARPMSLILGPFGDPATQQLDLGRRQFLSGIRWRHFLVRVGDGDAPHQFAGIGFAWDDCRLS